MPQRLIAFGRALLYLSRYFITVFLVMLAIGFGTVGISEVFSIEPFNVGAFIICFVATAVCVVGAIKIKPKRKPQKADSDSSPSAGHQEERKNQEVNCIKCSAKVPSGSRFCPACGAAQKISITERISTFLSGLFNTKSSSLTIHPKTEEEIAREQDRQVLSRDYAYAGCVYRDNEILHDSYRICRSTSSLTTFTERYTMLINIADRLYRADTYEIPNIVKLGERDLYRYILEEREDFKTIFLKNYSKNLFDKVGNLKTKKGKINRLFNGIDELEANRPLFEDVAEYDKLIEKIQRNADMLQ